jgi:hypothetical protein
MIKALRYTIDRVGDYEWQVFDEAKKGTSTVYYVFTTDVSGIYNHQLIITSYDGTNVSAEYPTFDLELYSMKFFASDAEQFESMVSGVLDSLFDTDIANPVELAHLFGGLVRSEIMRVPVFTDTN